jgi:hypothetical protein
MSIAAESCATVTATPLKRLGVVLLTSAVLQVGLASVPDQMGDLLVYRQWLRSLTSEGLSTSYWPPASTDPLARPAIDYPPMFPYLLWGLGHTIGAVAPAALQSDRTLDLLVRLIPVAFNLALTLLLYAAHAHDGAALACASFYAFNPAVLFDSAYWGQTDGVCAFLTVATLVLFGRGWPGRAWLTLTIAALVKPLAWPLVPLLVAFTLRRYGTRRLVSCLALSAAVAFGLLLPFVLAGRLREILNALLLQVDAMPYVSVNAHNLWWILGRGLPWTRVDAPLIGPLTGGALGLALLCVFYAATLTAALCSSHPRALERAAASVSLGFFMLATRMHENHGLLFLPLFLLAFGGERRFRAFFVAATALFTANMALHDPMLCHLARDLAPGPRVLLPQRPDVDPNLLESLARHGYPYASEEIRGEASVLWAGLTLLNSQAGLLLFASWLIALHGGERPWGAGRGTRLAALAGFLLVTGSPFMLRVLQAPSP